MQYYHRESSLLYKLGPAIMVVVSLLIMAIVDKSKTGTLIICFLMFVFGVFSLIYSRKRGDKVWVLKDGLLKTPEINIDLSNVKEFERKSINEDIFYILKLKEGDPVKIKPPFMPGAERKFLSVLRSTIGENRSLNNSKSKGVTH